MSSPPARDTRLLEQLRQLLGEKAVRADESTLERYGRDESDGLFFPPQVVVLPDHTAQVSEVLRFASAHQIPVTPRAGGTGLSGGALPVRGGIVLSVERLDRIRSIDTRNLTAEVESGVVTGELQRRVEAEGLFYPPDPASKESCRLGGNLAEDSAGPRSLKYGTTRRYVLGLEAVLPDGSVVATGAGTRKDVTAYNLSQLLVGSEGTLAVITAARLLLLPLPRASLTLLLPFPDLHRAAAAVEALCRGSWDPVSCELLDETSVAAVSSLQPLPSALQGQAALLLVGLDGDDSEDLLQSAADLGRAADELGAGEILLAQESADQRRLWQVRERVNEALRSQGPVRDLDTVVPRSALAELVQVARTIARREGLEVSCFGHAGDGNLHVTLLGRGQVQSEWERRRDATEAALLSTVLQMGGALAAEHGIGWTKRRHLPLAISQPLLTLMRDIKRAFDPLGILNPDKIFP